PPYTGVPQAVAGDVTEAWARLDGCGADAELIGLAKACLAAAPGARPADAAAVAGRVKVYRDEVAARQAEAERLLWIRAAGEAFSPVAEAARARLRQQAWALLRAEVAAQAGRPALRRGAPPRRPPPGRCSKPFAAFPSWPASATRRRWPSSPSPSDGRGRRSGRKSRGCCVARSRHGERFLGVSGATGEPAR